MDQAIFLLDNQYDPKVLDQVYHQIRETTWDHCISIQQAMMRQRVWDGPISDFKHDLRLNQKMGWPLNAYHIKLDTPIIKTQQRYVMSKFIAGQELISLREILQDDHFQFQYTLHIADSLYMEAKISITQRSTYILIIPGENGLTEEMWKIIHENIGNLYSPNRWTFIQRPKVSYVYANTTPLAIFNGQRRLYLNQFTEKKIYYVEDITPDWKVFISDNTENLGLLTGTFGEFKYDDTGAPYIEISETFYEHIRSTMNQIYVFAYHEDRRVGSALSPNYIGVTGYLKTVFDEYITAVNSSRFKVLAQLPEGGWERIDGTDTAFTGEDTDLIAVGYETTGECWVYLPTKNGVGPVNPNNFRIWEYYPENDSLGRMVATGVTASFPSFYHYHLESEAPILYIEWFRDDDTVGAEYEDFLKPYRDYVGLEFPYRFLNGEVPAIVGDFNPVHSVFDETDFIKNVLLYSSHEYRVNKMIEILSETGMHYDTLQNAIDAQNVPYTTAIFKLAMIPGMYEKLHDMGSTAKLIMGPLMKSKAFDIYIDGVWDGDAVYDMDSEGNQCIYFDATAVTPTSVIIVDCYDADEQIHGKADVGVNFLDSRIWDFPLEYISGNDLVVTFPDNTRVNPINLDYGLLAKELLVQVPETMVDWDALEFDIDDPRIADRVGSDRNGGPFKSVVFRFVIPAHDKYAILKSMEEENLTFFDVNDRRITVLWFGMLVTTEGYNEGQASLYKFSKKVYSTDLCLHIADYTIDAEQLQTVHTEDIQEENAKDLLTDTPFQRINQGNAYVGEVNLYNCNVYAKSLPTELGVSLTTTFPEFYGADDPNRLLTFVNGVLQRKSAVSGSIPTKIGENFEVKFVEYVHSGEVGQVVYLPFPTERFWFKTDSDGQANLSGTGINVLGIHDLLFENGLRVPNDTITRVTNQIVKGTPNCEYDVVRLRRDSSDLYGFDDVELQSFQDKLFNQSPGYKYANNVF